jgi:transposase-like protein
MSMADRKRHSKAEIALKLAQATILARQGVLNGEIARTLGVSAMTLHRWRKIRPEDTTPAAPEEVARFEEELGSRRRLAELELENSRLRRLVTDLLLERIEFEEAAWGTHPPRGGLRTIR